MHLSMLSPTPPNTGMGGALPRDLTRNFVPRLGAFDLNEVQCISVGNAYIPYVSYLKNRG